ncbi:MAG TPA: hypothetical protein DCG63_03770 [Methylophilaceae bacterium]|nr:hypothetical protein [Methylophilaceae bacterium]
MNTFTIEVQDTEVRALLKRLHATSVNMQPIYQDIGEGIMERTKQRFSTGIGPDGIKWLPNAQATYAILANRLGKSSLGKDGRVNKKGASKLANKKPLIGETGNLARQFHVLSTNHSVTIGNSMIYAAIQQFGGQAGRNKKVTIPARPFLPVMINGQLYPQEQQSILNTLNAHLDDVINGRFGN